MNKTTTIYSSVDRIVGQYGTGVESVIPILQAIQNEFSYLPKEALLRVCETTVITPARIESVSSFYSQFRFQPAGKHIIRVCAGTACHVKGSPVVYNAFARELGLKDGENTDAKGVFSLEKVACLGCCTLAPVVKIDEVTYGHVRPEEVNVLLNDFLSKPVHTRPDSAIRLTDKENIRGEIRIGLGSCCVASGSEGIMESLEKTVSRNGINVEIKQVGCVGACNQVPMMEIISPGKKRSFYTQLKPEDVSEVVLNHFTPESFLDRVRSRMFRLAGRFVEDGRPTLFSRYEADQRETPLWDFLDPQMALATEHRGKITPSSIEDYRGHDGFGAIKRCLATMSPQEIIDVICASGLRGRGGAGYPTGKKWQLVKDQKSKSKYVICNGDEGDPGAFMDRMLLESYPFRIIEGMMIAGFATGATRGLFYIRAEYTLAVKRVKEAVEKCNREGLLGKEFEDSGFRFDISVFEGAGAFVCGEETALIASVEGNRGTPRLRPPYPAVSGLNELPTLVNNTETFSLVPWIIRNGAENFSMLGTPSSKGTKVFALAGKVRRGGLIEVPMGITIRQIVMNIGGGIINDRKFKAVQMGGPSGGCLPEKLADLPVDYEALSSAGAMMGSGGLIVLDDRDCMVDLAYYFLSFTQNQSCGKCTFCRIGTRRMLELLDKIRCGKGVPKDLTHLEQLAHNVQTGSLCGLGKTAPNPVLTTLRYFREEYEAHLNGHCPAGKCTALIRYSINEKCIGCTLCAQHCPSKAITFSPYEIHIVDQEKCIKCDLCRQVCPSDAVIVS